MSRGSTLTLYKKYNLKMPDNEFKAVIKKYADYNEKNDYASAEYKKTKTEYAEDIPPIMTIDAFRNYNVYDKETQKWINTRPADSLELLKKETIAYVDKEEHCYCEQLMEWDFGSQFDCLVERFHLASYNYKDSHMIITEDMAYEMLAAINYILGGNWNDKTERGMNNSYIHTFTEGYNCDSYWKYVHRHDRKFKNKTFHINEDGYDITIKCPVEKKKKKNDDDYDYEAELNESNEAIEWSLEVFRNGLIAFLKGDNWKRDVDDKNPWLGYTGDRKYQYVLTYEYWG